MQRSPVSGLAYLAILVLALVSTAWAQPQATAFLLADLDPAPVPASSDPTAGATLPDGRCVFAARTSTSGLELWIFGPQGPSLLKDIAPGSRGSAPTGFVLSGSHVYFSANDGLHGRELWRTDGTASGTTMVIDLQPGAAGSVPEQLVDAGGTLYFLAFDPIRGRELHRSNGTAAGTSFVAEVIPGLVDADITHLTGCGTKVFFIADDVVHGDELWVSDGTAAGTIRLSDFRPGVANGVIRNERPVCCGGKLYFQLNISGIGNELGVSDGTPAGTVLFANISPGSGSSSPGQFVCCGNDVYFAATTSATGRELFKTNGTAAGTVLVKDFEPGSSSSFPGPIVCCNGMIFVAAQESVFGKELYISDGTPGGTTLVKDIRPGFLSSGPAFMTCCGNKVYFSAEVPPLGTELWVSDGTDAGTNLVMDANPGSGNGFPRDLHCCGSALLYSSEGPAGRELYATDGTLAGTNLHDLDPNIRTKSSNPSEFTVAGPNQFYFAAETALGRELCFFDGAQVVIHDIEPGPGSSFPAQLTMVGNTLFFEARTLATGRELFKAVRNQAPALVQDLVPGSGSSTPDRLQAFGVDRVIFSATAPGLGTELAVAGFGINGIQMHDVRPGGSGSSPGPFTVVTHESTGTPLAFFGANNGTHGVELHVTNGTTFAFLGDTNPGTSGSSPVLTDAGRNTLGTDVVALPPLVVAELSGQSTIISTVEIIDPFGLIINRQALYTILGHRIEFMMARLRTPDALFGASTELSVSGNGTEFFTIDPVNGLVVHDLLPGTASSNPENFARSGDAISFIANVIGVGRELVRYDANTGALLVADALEGPESSNPGDTVPMGDSVAAVTSGSDIQDRFLHIFDSIGPATNIVPLGSKPPGEFSFADGLSRLFGGVVVGGDLGGTGTEPIVINNVGPSSTSFGQGTPGSSLTVSDPKLGGPVTITSIFPGQQISTTVIAAHTTPNSVPFIIGDSEVWMDIGTMTVLQQDVGNQAQMTVNLPNDPGLVGLQIVLQAAGFGPNVFGVTNAVIATIH